MKLAGFAKLPTCGTGGTTCNDLWLDWNGSYISNTITATSASNGGVWLGWNNSITAATTAITTWSTWNNVARAVARAYKHPETEAQRALREQRHREQQAQWELEQRILAGAKAKAEKLLVENLNDRQLHEYREKGFFTVLSNKGKEYRVYKRGSHGNVVLVRQGKEVESYCIQPANVPDGDAHLAQKLMLECDEDTFLKIANRTRLAAAA